MAVIEGAAVAFERGGYAATSLAEITELSGISQGAMYFHFKSKEQIALAVIQEQHERTYAHVEAALSEATDPMVRVILLSRVVCDLLLSDPVVRAGINLALEQRALQDASAESYETWTAGIANLLVRAEQEGVILSRIPIPKLARSLVGYFTGAQLMSQATTRRDDLLDSVSVMWEVFIGSAVRADCRARYYEIVDKTFTGESPAY